MAGDKKISVQDDGPTRGFQSSEAREAATAAAKPLVEDAGELGSAECGDVMEAKAEQQAPDTREDPMRMVRVRSRAYVPPFRYGNKRYTLPAGKEVLVPLIVRRHLEEKGLLA